MREISTHMKFPILCIRTLPLSTIQLLAPMKYPSSSSTTKVTVLLGESGVGKTSLITSLFHRPFRSEHIETLCREEHWISPTHQIWDIPPSCYSHFSEEYLSHADQVLLLTDPSHIDYRSLRQTLTHLHPRCHCSVVVNKIDTLPSPERLLEEIRLQLPSTVPLRGISCKRNQIAHVYELLSYFS